MIDKILRNPRAYKFLYQAQDDFNTIFGGGGIRGYLLKRKYFKRFKYSRVCIGAPLDDPQLNISIGRYSSASNPIAIVYVPAKDKKYEISIGSFTRIGPKPEHHDIQRSTLRIRLEQHEQHPFRQARRRAYKKNCKESYWRRAHRERRMDRIRCGVRGNVNIGGWRSDRRQIRSHSRCEPYSVVVGVPAKRKKYRFSER